MAKKRKSRFKDVTIKPSQGGKLMSRTSPSEAGAQNYMVKRDLRRDLDIEMRREGFDWFGDFEGRVDTGTQPFPTSDEINLIHMMRSPSGQTSLIVGTKTTLYQSQSLSFDYVEQITPASPDPGGDYVSGVGADPFFANYDWSVIGSGFSSEGNRWEAVNINGYTILNNGIDLPVVFRLEWSEVTPMYELRDQSVASVGTIAAFNNVLMLADIKQISDSSFISWMTGSTPYGLYSPADSVRYQYRILWSAVGDPTEFDASVTAAATSGSATVTMDWASQSFSAGDSVILYGGGVSGGNLITTVSSVTGTSLVLSDAAQTSTAAAIISRSSVLGSIVGYEDLTDDASGIIRMLELQGQLVVYKDTSIFLASFTGVSSLPFKFSRISIPSNKALFFRNTLVPVEGLYHVYAGRSMFYRFDIQNRNPVPMKAMDLCGDLFFEDPDINISSSDDIFSSVNTLTREIWVSTTSQSNDKVICLDYQNNTVSTSNVNISAAGAIKRPTMNITPVETESWFIMGTPDGTLLLYGRVDKSLSHWSNKSSIFSRRGGRVNVSGSISSGSQTFAATTSVSDLTAGDGVTVYGGSGSSQNLVTQISSITGSSITLASSAGVTLSNATLVRHMPLTTDTSSYDSTLKSGLSGFGDPFDEKDLRSFVPHFSGNDSSSTLGMSVNLYTTRNEHESPALIATKAIGDIGENLISLFSRGFFFQDEITVTGKENPVRLHQRSYEISRVNSRSASRMDNGA